MSLETLYQCACEYRFDDFERQFAELAAQPGGAPAEAFLMRAQVKLLAADEALPDDLEKAGGAGAPAFPCLDGQWVPDSPNRFVVFGAQPGALERFLHALPAAGEALGGWYGEAGSGMARQVQCEVLYYRGALDEALALAQEQARRAQRPIGGLLARHIQFRCHLATGTFEAAEQCMLEMIQTAKSHPECVSAYQVIRSWANLTTGWSGDTPRFREGEALPVLDDRLAAIRKGISQLSPKEEAFAEYARQSYTGACTMRQHYMDIFNALYWLQAGDHAQMAPYLERACRVSADSGLVMPFVEYGRQIVPLLECLEAGGVPYPKDWADKVTRLAEQYEENLALYRD